VEKLPHSCLNLSGVVEMYHFNWRPVFKDFPLLWQGLLLGLQIAVLSLAIGCVLGLIGAFARTYGPRQVRIAVTAYVEFVRNIPLLLIIYFVYFALPLIGISILDNLWSFVFALAIYSGAYLTETFRAGIESIGKGYIEAGKAIGLTRLQVALYVTVPLMFRIVLPSLGNTLISLFKDTSLASAISVNELTYGAIRINVNTWRIIEVYTVVGLMYLVTCYTIAGLLRLVERRLAVAR
jgi:His/Glu/Gln/Arg/opine family amino acid ABC transporter permease subunit